MAVLKCNICGGELELNADISVGKCQYCGSIVTIPKEIDKKEKLYNRATFLRQNNEFDKAIAVYEDILKEDYRDAEAHWGLVLSKYGIEYVKDPKTGKHIPTCHRTQKDSFLLDVDYKAAIEFADMHAERIYRKEAEQINTIQKKILEISSKEPPYDIFICYKESDENGKRTIDSVLAQELYQELIRKKYKVFFARKTLESKLGKEYEPIIFAALNSARVMLVLGTKPEYFNSVWVKNEWGRFRRFSSEEGKVIIPVYRDMSPYELPEELASLQAQDMSKLGFMQDLLDGIEKIMSTKEKRHYEEKVVSGDNRLVQNAATYLKLNNYEMADETYTRIIKEYPEDYRGWWGKIICLTKDFTQVKDDNRQTNMWFSYVKKLAPTDAFSKLEKQYCQYLGKVADREAENDIKKTEQALEKKRGVIKQLRQEMNEMERKKQEMIEEFSGAMEREKQDEEKYNKDFEDANKELMKKKRNKKISALCALLGIFFIVVYYLSQGVISEIMASVLSVLGVITLSAAFILVIVNEKREYLESNLNEAKVKLDEQLKKMENQKRSQDLQIATEVNIINEKKKQISFNLEEVEKYQKYLGFGKERLSAMHYARECNKVGVDTKIEKEVSDCREALFG